MPEVAYPTAQWSACPSMLARAHAARFAWNRETTVTKKGKSDAARLRTWNQGGQIVSAAARWNLRPVYSSREAVISGARSPMSLEQIKCSAAALASPGCAEV
jgi:hypothetical protein